jgi:methylated-DNA-[protein]-cysteine S-methyltransferase
VITIDLCECETPLGGVTAATRQGKLVALTFSDGWPKMEARLVRRFGRFERRHVASQIQTRLDAYFARDRTAFDDVVPDPGGTEFQRAVWTELRQIPAGSTTTYSALARAIGSPKAVRAVGAANGANPIWLIIPCHRAIGSDGSLTGYAGGLERKRQLLAHEALCAPLRASLVAQSAIQFP